MSWPFCRGNLRRRVWTDQQIDPGTKWNDGIESALMATRVAVLLVSRAFVSSEFILKSELPAVLQAADRGQLTLGKSERNGQVLALGGLQTHHVAESFEEFVQHYLANSDALYGER